MPYPEKIVRNEQIYHMIESGATFAEVAATFNINPTRVLQIYNAVFRRKVQATERKKLRRKKSWQTNSETLQ